MGKSHLETLKEEYLANQIIIAKYQEQADCGLALFVEKACQRLEAIECEVTALLGARTKNG